jgi:hypothetical protein
MTRRQNNTASNLVRAYGAVQVRKSLRSLVRPKIESVDIVKAGLAGSHNW